jgi:hypothetical protein
MKASFRPCAVGWQGLFRHVGKFDFSVLGRIRFPSTGFLSAPGVGPQEIGDFPLHRTVVKTLIGL